VDERLVELRWTVSDAAAAREGRLGPRLDDFLADRVPLLSRMHLQSSVRSGAVLVDGRRAPPGFRLHAGAQVEARLDPERASAMTPESIPVEIAWEDERLAVVEKPAGMLAHPTRGVKRGTLANALSGAWEGRVRPVLVHRLDKETSGLMVVAKSREAGAALARAFASGAVEKRYSALLDGVLREDEHVIEAPIARVSDEKPQWRVGMDGKPARTLLRVIERGPEGTLVELTPVTGRTNQLRIHCAAIGHPITGDQAYGGGAAERVFLHACRLAFPDPGSGERLEFRSPSGFSLGEGGIR
jgi:23S rRNA pseudouridine1911/1915/1917 synthase